MSARRRPVVKMPERTHQEREVVFADCKGNVSVRRWIEPVTRKTRQLEKEIER